VSRRLQFSSEKNDFNKMKIIEKETENVDEIKGLLTEKQSADYLNVSYETLRKNLRPKKKISFVRISNSVRYKLKDLDAYIEKCRVEAKK
jgi:excisionase family DNA binding protein